MKKKKKKNGYYFYIPPKATRESPWKFGPSMCLCCVCGLKHTGASLVANKLVARGFGQMNKVYRLLAYWMKEVGPQSMQRFGVCPYPAVSILQKIITYHSLSHNCTNFVLLRSIAIIYTLILQYLQTSMNVTTIIHVQLYTYVCRVCIEYICISRPYMIFEPKS